MQMPNTRRIRQILAAVIITVSVALVGTIVVRNIRSDQPVAPTRPIPPDIDMSIDTLSFSETRGNEKLWNLSAKRVDYDKQSGVALLSGVTAEIFGSKTGGMVITSVSGSYDEPKQLVLMQQQVHAVTKKGMEFDTDQLEYRTGPGIVRTTSPVQVRDGRLTLTASGMEMTLVDEQARFAGPVNAVIKGYHAKR